MLTVILYEIQVNLCFLKQILKRNHGGHPLDFLTDSKVNEIRCVINRNWVLRDDVFKLMLEKESGMDIILNNRGGFRSAE